MSKTLSVGVILFHTPAQQLHQFLNSLAIATNSFDEIRLEVLDNSGIRAEEDIRDLVHSYLGARCNFVWHPSVGNIGFGRAHNLLMRSSFESGAEYYLCVNPDGFFHPHVFDKLAHHLKFNSENSLVELRQLPSEHPKPYDAITLETPWCSGAALIIPKKIFEATQGFDENIFMYCEDVDLSWRARLLGFNCIVAADAYFYHDVSGRKCSPSRDKHLFLAARYLGWKWKNPQFVEHVDQILIDRKLCTDARMLPNLVGHDQIDAGINEIESVVEFRRLFHFSEVRWTIK